MRLLHTSDWHIGRKFHQLSLLEDQLAFGEWLSQVIRSESIDQVLISGDLYDRAAPSGDAVEALNKIFTSITEAGAGIIAISGNHDSGERLNFGSAAMSTAGIHLRAERPHLSAMGSPINFKIPGHDPLQVLPLPYIDPYRVTDLNGATPQHSSVLTSVLSHRESEIHNPARTIVMAHAFVTGGMATDSERELSVGGTSMVPAEVFRPFGYTALGHLHRPQTVGSENVVYSGSPLAYSFSEEHPKSVRIIEVGAGIASKVLPIEVGKPVYTVKDTLENLLSDPKWEYATTGFVRAQLTDPNLQLGAMEKLRQRFEHLLELEQVALTAHVSPSGTAARDMMRRSPGELLSGYLEATFPDLDQEDQLQIFKDFDQVARSSS
jgi:exonuclease SbcD